MTRGRNTFITPSAWPTAPQAQTGTSAYIAPIGAKEGPNIPFEIVVIVALILVNGVFAGAEIAVVSLRKSQIHGLLEAKRKGAKALATLRHVPERFLATVQVGITVVGTTAAAFGGASLADDLTPVVKELPLVGDYAPQVSIGVVVASISYLSLVLGELVPKSLALRVNEAYALLVAKPLLGLSFLARPLVWFLTASSNLVLAPFRDRTTFVEGRLSKAELLHIMDEAAETGALSEHASELALRALSFEDLRASDVMVPRHQIVALSALADQNEIRQCLMDKKRSRMPVYEGTLDNVVGYVTAKDLLSSTWDKSAPPLKSLLRPVRIVTESTSAVDLLRMMREDRHRLAIVVDEHGGVVGLVTLEDVLEELVGEVFSEHEQTVPAVVPESSGALLVRGDVPLRDVNRQLEHVELKSNHTATTVAALCIELAAGAIPNRGARLAANDGIVLEIVGATPRAVRRVRITPPIHQTDKAI